MNNACENGERLSSIKLPQSKDSNKLQIAELLNETPILLSKVLIQRIERRLGSSDFKTVPEYITYILEHVLSEIEKQEEEKRATNPFSKEDQANVEERLRNLGYL